MNFKDISLKRNPTEEELDMIKHMSTVGHCWNIECNQCPYIDYSGLFEWSEKGCIANYLDENDRRGTYKPLQEFVLSSIEFWKLK